MRKKFSSLWHNSKGATALEFALVAPALFMLMFGTLEYGIVMVEQAILEGATAEAGRKYKALSREEKTCTKADNIAIKNYIYGYGGGLLNKENLNVYPEVVAGWGGAGGVQDEDNPSGCGTVSSVVQYNVFYDYHFMTPLIKRLLGGEKGKMTLHSATVVQNEPAVNSSKP